MMMMMKCLAIFVLAAAVLKVDAETSKRRERNAVAAVNEPLFRDKVDPEMGGKVPESGLLRAELNKIDASGLDATQSQQMTDLLKDMQLFDKVAAEPAAPLHHSLPPHRPSLLGHHSPYARPPGSYSPAPTGASYLEPAPPAAYQPAAHQPPHPGYGHPSSPAPYEPKAPVLLEKRPYAPKEVRPLDIVTYDAYTSFDCRGRHYETFYADEEAGCTLYHLCHSGGKQDTFQCPYGTIFNEYIGTCDHPGATNCHSGQGYHKPDPPPRHEPTPSYHGPTIIPPYHPPQPTLQPYHPPPYAAEPLHHQPSPAPYRPTPEPYHHPSPSPYHPSTPAPYSDYKTQSPTYKPFIHF